MRAAALTVIISTLFSGCVPKSNLHRYSQAQLSALTMREVDAGLDATYRAAVEAVFDLGFTVSSSDSGGGVLTASRKIDRTTERIWIYPYINDTEYAVSILLREVDSTRTSVRVSLSINGEAQVDEKWVGEFWRLMKRQVLMKEPGAVLEGQPRPDSAATAERPGA